VQDTPVTVKGLAVGPEETFMGVNRRPFHHSKSTAPPLASPRTPASAHDVAATQETAAKEPASLPLGNGTARSVHFPPASVSAPR
jgi:hypothetical protein